MVEIKDKVKEIEDRISELEVVNVSLHNLREWYNLTDFWNEHSLWYFGRDKLLDKKGYRTLWEVKEVVVSLATGHIASRRGAILEEKKPYRILTHIPPPEALNVVREVIGNYRGSHCEILKYSFTWFKNLEIYLPPTRYDKGCSVHLRGKRGLENKCTRRIVDKLIKSSLFNKLLDITSPTIIPSY